MTTRKTRRRRKSMRRVVIDSDGTRTDCFTDWGAEIDLEPTQPLQQFRSMGQWAIRRRALCPNLVDWLIRNHNDPSYCFECEETPWCSVHRDPFIREGVQEEKKEEARRAWRPAA